MKKGNYIFYEYSFCSRKHKFLYYLGGLASNSHFVLFLLLPCTLLACRIADELIGKYLNNFNIYTCSDCVFNCNFHIRYRLSFFKR